MAAHHWTTRDIPDLHGRTAVVTGANTGLGFAIASVLAQRGAEVVLACRSEDRASAAADRIRGAAPGSVVRTVPLDLESQDSVRVAAQRLHDAYDHIDLLVNNAGGFRPRYAVTEDGFEATMAVNHLGPFAFTGLLRDMMTGVPGSRVVTVASNGHRNGTVDPANLNPQRGKKYRYIAAYNRAKLANLLFTYELNRRFEASTAQTVALAGHAGLARTDGARDMSWVVRTLVSPKINPIMRMISQSAEMGALGPLRAATDPQARGGEYYGPRGNTGHPVRAVSSATSQDVDLQRRLWAESERLTSVTY
ncbi:oxidoreductase [Streptomyces werraensis]|uniref:oxidoreductase n=1 Tax=Streptomyces werraensis TaxID=68284 RepID=UPI001CE2D7B0